MRGRDEEGKEGEGMECMAGCDVGEEGGEAEATNGGRA